MEQREIKFRAWDGKQMRFPNLIEVKYLTCYNVDRIEPESFTASELMQYAGLKDKNGKEIYEGDIIIVNGLTGFVKYLGCCFMLEWIGADVYSDLLGWDDYKRGKISEGNEYEVIGNIYETPTLIK